MVPRPATFALPVYVPLKSTEPTNARRTPKLEDFVTVNALFVL